MVDDPYAGRPPEAMVTPGVSMVALTAGAGAFTPTRYVHCNTDGSFTLIMSGDSSTVTLTMVAGTVYPYRVKQLDSGVGLVAGY